MADKTHEMSRSAADAQTELLQTFVPKTRKIVEGANAFGDSLRRSVFLLRNRKGWTQGHLGEQVGVSASTISRLEKGRGVAGLDLDLAVAAFAALGVAPEFNIVPLDDERAWAVGGISLLTLADDDRGSIQGMLAQLGVGTAHADAPEKLTGGTVLNLDVTEGLVAGMNQMAAVQNQQIELLDNMNRLMQSLRQELTRIEE